MAGHAHPPLCEQCRNAFAQLRGVAHCRGHFWAVSIAARRPAFRTRPWPRDARAHAIARRKVADLAREEHLIEALADEVHAGAARFWDAGES